MGFCANVETIMNSPKKAEASRAKWNWDNDISGNQPFWNGGEQLASSCADAIRARGNG